MKLTIFILSLLLTFFLFSHTSNATVTCGDVATKAVSCVAFVTGKQPKPTPVCCRNLKMLAASAKTVNDKRAICRCLKEGVNAFPGVKDKYLSQVPRLCGIRIPFPVSLNTNCDRYLILTATDALSFRIGL
ncbi:Non-specific lipid-transfer protein [Rhynchospora pubera]|uniref:Non-specific lipid-transfer protein n=1 Tax=Rhynchospora pubera TaxID=906938 RepID=A0AAV8FA68_9POAL|nr:Non-specific lipid-transfer protein [Rhynchospora pubera]